MSERVSTLRHWEDYWRSHGNLEQTYSTGGRLHREIVRDGDVRGRRVLEVGAGSGRDLLALVRAQVRDRRGHELVRGVRVAGELDRDLAVVADGGERAERGRDVERALAERQVLVDAAPHVLDVDVDEPVGGAAERAQPADAVRHQSPRYSSTTPK